MNKSSAGGNVITAVARLKLRGSGTYAGSITWGNRDISRDTRDQIKRALKGIGLEDVEVEADGISYEIHGLDGKRLEPDIRKALPGVKGKDHRLTQQIAVQLHSLVVSRVKAIFRERRPFGSSRNVAFVNEAVK